MMILKRFIVIVWLLLATGGLVIGDLEAHAGGRMQVASADAGDFKLTIWTSPDPARTGKIHVATAVASAETALPILDAAVSIEIAPRNGQGETLTGQALTEDSTNQFLYESIIEVRAEGSYLVTVSVAGTEGERGEVSFELVVEPAPPLIFGIMALLVAAVITGGAVWFYLRSTQPQLEAKNKV